jgi:hypothetical protein
MRGVAIGTVCPRFVSPVIPALIHRIHDVTIVTGRGIIAEVGGEVGDIQPHSKYGEQGY